MLTSIPLGLYHVPMSNFEMPVDLPENHADATDVQVRETWGEVRRARIDKNLPVPRLVNALNKSGYTITAAEYKDIEQKPLKAADHVRAGILHHIERILNSERIADSAQHRTTVYAMAVLSDARKEKGYSYYDMSVNLMSHGIAVQPNSIRTAEQGITRLVSWDYIVTSAEILEIDPRDLFA